MDCLCSLYPASSQVPVKDPGLSLTPGACPSATELLVASCDVVFLAVAVPAALAALVVRGEFAMATAEDLAAYCDRLLLFAIARALTIVVGACRALARGASLGGREGDEVLDSLGVELLAAILCATAAHPWPRRQNDPIEVAGGGVIR